MGSCGTQARQHGNALGRANSLTQPPAMWHPSYMCGGLGLGLAYPNRHWVAVGTRGAPEENAAATSSGALQWMRQAAAI